MNCKKCGQDLSGRDYKQVAEWSFCLDCFTGLMNKAEEKEAAEDTPAAADAPVDQPRATQQCQVCHAAIPNNEGRRMLGLLFCGPCYDTLVNRPVLQPREEADETEVKTAVAQVRVDVNAPIQCHGCGRQIKAIGSKEVDGNAYCPDCFYALPPAPPPSDTDNEPLAAIDAPGQRTCQACSRPVSSENMKLIEGFDICAACCATDPDTALSIARTRHRLALEQMKKELNIG